MSALAANRTNFNFVPSRKPSRAIAATTANTIYDGAMVLTDSSGTLIPSGSGASGYWAGVCDRGNTRTGHTTDSCLVQGGGQYQMAKASATAADIGKLAYVVDDQTVAVATTGMLHVYIAGRITAIIDSATVMVDIEDRVTGQTS